MRPRRTRRRHRRTPERPRLLARRRRRRRVRVRRRPVLRIDGRPAAHARPVVQLAITANGRGYWVFASDGGVFAFGDAHFYGSSPHEVFGSLGADFMFPFQDHGAVAPPSTWVEDQGVDMFLQHRGADVCGSISQPSRPDGPVLVAVASGTIVGEGIDGFGPVRADLARRARIARGHVRVLRPLERRPRASRRATSHRDSRSRTSAAASSASRTSRTSRSACRRAIPACPRAARAVTTRRPRVRCSGCCSPRTVTEASSRPPVTILSSCVARTRTRPLWRTNGKRCGRRSSGTSPCEMRSTPAGMEECLAQFFTDDAVFIDPAGAGSKASTR